MKNRNDKITEPLKNISDTTVHIYEHIVNLNGLPVELD